MANISLTLNCNRSCKYCFTQSASKNLSKIDMPTDIFKQALDFIDRSNIKQIRLLGGEPTIHPHFPELIDMALKKNKPIRLFSNGFIPPKVLSILTDIPKNLLTIILNVTDFEEQSSDDREKNIRIMKQLGLKIMLGFNIYKLNQSFEFLIFLINKYNLKRIIRLGISHPCIGTKNNYLLPKFYFQIGQKIMEFYQTVNKNDIIINFDCGFVPCMFQKKIKNIRNIIKEQTGLKCNPVLDILPDGRIISCYPLFPLDSVTLTNKITADEVKNQFESQLALYKSVGIYKFCSICRIKTENLCSGGCIAQKIQRINQIPFSIKIKIKK